ncbi:MAG: class E sortase [Propioniciclava sp.]
MSAGLRRAAPPPRPGIGAALIGLISDLLITTGALLLLFVLWQLFWTDVVSDAAARKTVTELEQDFGTEAAQPPAPDLGEAYAIVHIPRFGEDYARPLYQGTDRETLTEGIGHYDQTAGPGEIGNFAIAGHRTTYGKPFNQIDDLESGDVLIIRTIDQWTVYRVTSSEIVLPTAAEVILPVPGNPTAEPTEALITLTSCHPEFSARERYIVHGVLEATYPADAEVPADLWKVD